ncbi:hypothetical protein [Oceanivirga miroungae]|uniref:Uncharacterized protein n=1 Tax=Oceanivirga miroungae TaxID=1130046 RepID=A0A6I8MEE9_9FUSO|nr:hypothetical protein [Oceanivirga miroungae]VWL85597.1 hypothetical protein OMES3154_00883 [Oceanivirga miroungae]
MEKIYKILIVVIVFFLMYHTYSKYEYYRYKSNIKTQSVIDSFNIREKDFYNNNEEK